MGELVLGVRGDVGSVEVGEDVHQTLPGVSVHVCVCVYVMHIHAI